MRPIVRRLAALAWGLALVSSAGCGSPPPAVATDTGTPSDDAATVVRCTRDEECDDLHFCNGVEQCLPAATGSDARGCLARTTPRCAAMQICDEITDECITDCGTTRDADGDGHEAARCGGDDCDDSDAQRFPGNEEVCDVDAHDEDCNEDSIGTRDIDGDRVLDAACCNVRSDGTMNCGTDCDDSRASVSPAAGEICNLIDDDCDGTLDEGVLVAGFLDADGDLYGDSSEPQMACPGTARFVTEGGDCDDDPSGTNGPIARSRNPGQPEICDHLDNDCDGTVEESTGAVVWYADRDGDGFGAASSGIDVSCTPLPGFSLLATDCDDTLVTVSPVAAELCNGLDDNCNGLADFLVGASDTEDDDRDGAADLRCPVTMPDCDDHDPLTYPSAPELCDGRDNDCNGVVDTATTSALWYVDQDHDRFGDSQATPVTSCEPQTGRVPNGADCDDARADVHPGARDGCVGQAGADDDCDLQVDEDTADLAFFVDADGDGYGSGTPVLACTLVAGRVTGAGDCDDLDPTRSPGASEACDAASTRDVDCDGLVGCDDADCASAAACVVSYRVRVVSGDGQTPQITRATAMPVVFALEDATSGAPVTGATLVLSAAGGGAVAVAGGTSDAAGNVTANVDGSGRVTAVVRGGIHAAPFTVTARAPHATPATAHFTSVPAVNGWAVPIVGPTHGSSTPLTGPASAVQSGATGPQGIAVASDGTIYWSDYYASAVFRIDPSGIQTRFAGSSTPGTLGDGGLAIAAGISGPFGLALDEPARLLYVAASDRIRVIDLTTQRIFTYAGGGTAPAPGYGDEGPATSAQTPGVDQLAVGPGHELYFSTANRLRRIDAAGIVHDFLTPAASCTSATTPVFRGCNGTACGVAWDASGTLFVAGNFCIGGQSTGGIVRREADGSFSALVGNSTGATTDATAGELTSLISPLSLAFDSGGHLYYSDSGQHAVRRVDTASGRVTTVLGQPASAGTTGDYGPGSAARTSAPRAIAFDASGNLYVTEAGGYSIRMIPGAALPTTHVSLEVASGPMQTVTIGRTIPVPMGATVRDEAGDPIRGVAIRFAIDETSVSPRAATISATSVFSGLTGVATVGGRAGLVEGTYLYRASFRDIHGAHASGSPVTFRIDATAPANGTIFPILGAARASGSLTAGHPVDSLTLGIHNVATGPDGAVYLAAYYEGVIYRILDGVGSIFAGGGATVLDGVPATTSRRHRWCASSTPTPASSTASPGTGSEVRSSRARARGRRRSTLRRKWRSRPTGASGSTPADRTGGSCAWIRRPTPSRG